MFYPGGNYDYPNNNIPFPIDGAITNENLNDISLKFNIISESPESNIFEDGSGNNNNGYGINNYSPKFDSTNYEPKRIKNTTKIRISKDKRAF